MTNHYLAEKIRSIRELLDFVEAHPDVNWFIPATSAYCYFNGEDAASELANTATAIGGKWDKVANDWEFGLERYFGDRSRFDPIRVRLVTERSEVCEKVKVGTKLVDKPDPDYEAPEVPTIKVEEDIFEWKCPPSILALADKSNED